MMMMITNDSGLFIPGIIIIGLPLVGFIYTIYEFQKMDKNPENYMRPQKKRRKRKNLKKL